MRTVVRAFPLALIVAAVLAGASSAGTTQSPLRLTEAGRSSFPERAFVLTLPSRRSLSADQIQVLENGKPVVGVTVVPAEAASVNEFGVVLVIDASNSMRGRALTGALQAAQVFSTRRTPNEKVALVTFNRRAHVLLPFTTDAGAIEKALSSPPELVEGTHIYDAVGRAVSLLKDAKIAAGSIVVLSDGTDTGSRKSRDAVAAAAARAHVRVFTVGLRSSQFDAAALESLATTGSGHYSEASSAKDLSRIYGELGTQLANEYLVRYASLAGPNAKIRVTISVKGVQGAVRSGYKTPPLEEVSRVPYKKSVLDDFWGSAFTMVVITLLIALLLAVAIALIVTPRQRSLRRRLSEFVTVNAPAERKKAPSSPLGPVGRAELGPPNWWSRFKESVELAEMRLSPTQIVAWTAVSTLLSTWLAIVISGSAVLVLFAFAIPLIVWSLINRKVDKKRQAFADQLPDNLAVLASAMRAGHSLVGALSVVVDDAPEPARAEFRRVVADEQLGMPLETALEVVVHRMRNEDLRQVALVAILQRETGGNTAEVLDRVVETVRERQDLRRVVRTLTAQGRLSRWIVSFIPVVLLLVISLVNPGYLHPLFHESSGRLLLGFAAVLIVSGSLVIKKIVNIKV